jgi:hypothetical protein
MGAEADSRCGGWWGGSTWPWLLIKGEKAEDPMATSGSGSAGERGRTKRKVRRRKRRKKK